MPEFRIFISSPGDAAIERRRTDNVVSRLNGEFAGLARLRTVRWETERYMAHATFQTQIPCSADCDIVIGILKWRLGTELPPDFAHLPSGDAYPSGTAYEILTAIDKRRLGGELPDVFVFRYSGGAPHPRLDDPHLAAIERDWAALRAFFERWFVTRQGHFIAALNGYETEDHFESQVEALLRKWVAEKVSSGRAVPWPPTKGSPFRGLGVFGTRHAPVFFGRGTDIRKATDVWRDGAAKRSPFLLVVGASGAGKSSLARAGLIPRLVTPGVVAEVDLWRVAAMRPGDSPDGPFAALASALLQREADLPADEEGRGPALPEIAEGDSKTAADLATVLAQAGTVASKPIVNALARLGERARNAERYGREVRCDLVLLIDQLDELFAPSITAEVRNAFVALLTALVASGRVWLLATLRADLYAAMIDVPALKALKDGGTSYDLAPPGAVELADMVREPAKAAALTFASDPATGEQLDERLLREADRPDMLPLVQLALSRLWDARETVGHETMLPLAAFEKLGGLTGIVDEAGEAALATVGDAERAKLAPLLRRLAELSRDRAGTAGLIVRAVTLAEAAPDAPSRALVDALVAARLLTLAGDGTTTTVRLAHQRVLTDWARAKKIVGDSADFYRVRDEVEAQRDRWTAGNRRAELLLARGLPLAEARAMAMEHGAELSPDMTAFIAASRRRANRAQAIGWAAAALFAVLGIGAGVAAKVAFDQRAQAEAQRQLAQRNFDAAKQTVDGLIFNIAHGLKDVAGMRVETIRTILDTVRKTVDQLLATAPDNPDLLRSRAAMLDNFTTTYLAAGDQTDALAAAAEELGISRRLAALASVTGLAEKAAQAQRDLSVSLNKVGDVKLQAGDQSGALVAYREGLDIRRNLAAQRPDDAPAQRDLAISLNEVGDIDMQAGERAGASASYGESLAIFRKLAGQNAGSPRAQRDLAAALVKTGDVALRSGDQAGAISTYEDALGLFRALAAHAPGNSQAQRDLAIALTKIGDVDSSADDPASAAAAFSESLDIRRKLAAQDPGNAQAQRDVAVALEKTGDLKLQSGDRSAAASAYRDSLAICRKLATQTPDSALAQHDVAVALIKTGDVDLQAGDKTRAGAAYEQSLAIFRTLATRDPANAQAQRDVAIGLDKTGNVRLIAGDRAGASAAYAEGLDISRKLAAKDSGNAQAQRDLSIALEKSGDAKMKMADTAGALAAYAESLGIRRKLAAEDMGDAQAQRDVSVSLKKIGDARQAAGDSADARAAFEEAVAITRKLAMQDKANPEAQWDFAGSLMRTAAVSHDPAPLYREALAICETLERAGRLAPSHRDAIPAIRQKLAALEPAKR